ncbi:hypothetical protein BVY03_05190 [bacterium K02(2017)]|nr:hypothetical protein BVY03_05190 [bacterium K02(2017)]
MKINKYLLIFLICFVAPAVSLGSTKKVELLVDREFGAIHQVAVPQEFKLNYAEESTRVMFPAKIKENDAYVKMQFVSLKNKLKENLILYYLKVPMREADKRVVLIKKMLVGYLKDYPQATLINTLEIKKKKRGPVDIVVVNVQNGPYYLNFYGVINHKSQHCLLGLVNIDPQNSSIKKIDHLNDPKLGDAKKVLMSIKFGKELM